MFYFDKIKGKTVMKSDLLLGLNHVFTTRESFIKTKDEGFSDIVNKNKQMFCNFFEINENNLISPEQRHTANIEYACVGKKYYANTDAIILKNKEQVVFMNFADCTPIVIFDKKQQIAAIAHAGWRGTAAGISAKTTLKLVEECGSEIEDIRVAIGPAISKSCYEVGENVLEELMLTVNDKADLYEFRTDKIYVDLKAINKRQLEEIGVNEIDVCPYCTCCENDKFFSYRKENETTNRHNVIIKLSSNL